MKLLLVLLSIMLWLPNAFAVETPHDKNVSVSNGVKYIQWELDQSLNAKVPPSTKEWFQLQGGKWSDLKVGITVQIPFEHGSAMTYVMGSVTKVADQQVIVISRGLPIQEIGKGTYRFRQGKNKLVRGTYNGSVLKYRGVEQLKILK